jgi:hypothetical protein
LADTLKEVLNRGATLYNGGDRNGCYHLFEGALLALRPQLANQAELLQIVENALRDAEQHQTVGERAWALRTALIDVRNKLAMSEGRKSSETPQPRPSAEVPPPSEPIPPSPPPAPRKVEQPSAAPSAPSTNPAPPAERPAEAKPAAPDSLKGTITLDGKPITTALVRLTHEEGVGKGYTAKVKDGSFEVNNVAPGKYKMAITSTDKAIAFPAKYGNSTTTPVTIEVNKGSQRIDINLRGK